MRRLYCIFFILLSSFFPAGTRALADDSCPVAAPVAEVRAARMYSDAAGSVIDAQGLRQNTELILPLRTFDRTVADRVDRSDPTSRAANLDCAAGMLHAWAAGRAMLIRPASFPASRERARFVLGLNIASLKLFSLQGHADPVVVAWLQALNRDIMGEFARRDVVDNLYVWSGVNAASFALLNPDGEAIRYQQTVWQKGLAQIGSDGFLPSELRRKERALGYHHYYLSGLLVLRRLRAALGQAPTAAEDTALRRLADTIEDGLCDPTAMMRASGGSVQAPLEPDGFAIGLVFGHGIIDARWSRCGKKPARNDDETLGGRLDITAQLLQEIEATREIASLRRTRP